MLFILLKYKEKNEVVIHTSQVKCVYVFTGSSMRYILDVCTLCFTNLILYMYHFKYLSMKEVMNGCQEGPKNIYLCDICEPHCQS